MKFTHSSKISDIIIITPDIFGDERGFFTETYREDIFAQNDINVKFIQDNHSRSQKGVLRGMHFQKPPFSQSKLVRCTKGVVLDVAVDCRQKSDTFGEYEMIEISEENKKMIFIPQGFAHGFVALTDIADFQYKCDNYYNKESEGGIIYNDPKIAIHWPEMKYIISDKDKLLGDLDTVREIF
jgi:dTDP-4-dehydrorhamnose 3,5-epimerase